MNTTKTNHQHPDLILEFSKGDYNHALRCYETAQRWVVETGLYLHQDMHGVILRPEHPQCPWEEILAPFDLLDDPSWTLRVQFFITTEDVLNWVKQLTLPEGSVFTVPPTNDGVSSEVTR